MSALSSYKTPASAVPTFIAFAMFLLAFIPGANLVSLVMIPPIGLISLISWMRTDAKFSRIFFTWVFLAATAVVAVSTNVNAILT